MRIEKLLLPLLLPKGAAGVPAGALGASAPIQPRNISTSILVEKPSSNPAELLACLSRHRITALACNMTTQPMAVVASPPPPKPECSGGAVDSGSICFDGRGICKYDPMRGFYCRCSVPRLLARGSERAALPTSATVPHCIDD